MTSSVIKEKTHPLSGRQFAVDGVSISPIGFRERVSLRADEKSAKALGKTLALPLPTKPNTSSVSKGRAALWMGPDEWLLMGDDGTAIEDTCRRSRSLHSAVSVSNRNTAIRISGSKAVLVLNGGCPRYLDLAVFPVGACSRTVLGKAEITLWRIGEDDFQVEVWRSFSDYVWKFLVASAKTV